MSYPYFDNSTIVLYFVVGSICVIAMKCARGSNTYSSVDSVYGFTLLFLTLLLFAGLRKVGLHLGGEDALRYQEGFIEYFNSGADRYETTDVLFGIFTGFIRHITDDPVIYRFCCYGLISFGYVYFIKTLCPNGISAIPFICILIPYMNSFGSMRNTMSIALFLLSIVALYNKNWICCFIFLVCSILMHRLSLVMLSFFPFYFIFRNIIIKASSRNLVIFIIFFVILSYALAVQLQKYIILFSLFEDNGNADMWYLTNGQGKNILLSWPMYLVHVLLFIALFIRYDRITKTKQIEFLIICFVFDIIILPATLVLGMWRFAQYLYISNLILWAVLIPSYCKKFSINSRIIVKTLCYIGFSALLIIRLTREYMDLALMPYLFLWE